MLTSGSRGNVVQQTGYCGSKVPSLQEPQIGFYLAYTRKLVSDTRRGAHNTRYRLHIAVPTQCRAVHIPYMRSSSAPAYLGLSQHGVHECRLAVVDMSDDGDVANVFSLRLGIRVTALYRRRR